MNLNGVFGLKKEDLIGLKEGPLEFSRSPAALPETEVRKGKSESAGDDEGLSFLPLKKKAQGFLKSLKGAGNLNVLKKEKKEAGKPTAGGEEIDLKKTFSLAKTFIKKNSRWLVPLLFLIIIIFLSTYLRMIPASLSITDDWAEKTVHDFYRSQLEEQINQQYPHLPEQNRKALVEKGLKEYLVEDKETIEGQIAQLSQQYRSNFLDEKGEIYLSDIDTYLWYSLARNVVTYGHLGDELVDGKPYFSLRNGRLGKESSPQFHPYFTAYLYQFLHFFDQELTLKSVLYLMSVIIIGLGMIPAFFIGRKIAGNTGGLFAAAFLAVNGPLISRTPAGFADTDAYHVFFPLMISWLFLEAYTAQKTRTKVILSLLSGCLVGFYAFAWSGWSFIFLFVLATILMALALKLGLGYLKDRQLNGEWLKKAKAKDSIILFVTFFVSSGIVVAFFKNWGTFFIFFKRIMVFTTLKEVGVKSIWPNVLTTVAEFNTVSFENIINQMGGQFLFCAALIGIILTLVKKTGDKKAVDEKAKNEEREYVYFILLALWLAGAAYSFTKGIRFAVLMAPPFALGLGSAFGFVYEKGSYWVNKSLHLDRNISRFLILIILVLFLISPFDIARNITKYEIPTMNDQWYDTLIKIKEDSASTKAIITSWWDFGHWFVAIAERKVTFDGGDQGERIHWVGRVLRTDDEPEAIGILRMLNCAQETAPHPLDQFTGDNLESIKILYEIFPFSGRDEARKKYQALGLTAEEAEVMLNYTHCPDLIPNYFITSDDMVGKAGVWGHFGSWDFDKAAMYQNTKELPREEAIAYLTENFGLTEEQADQVHSEIQTTKGDQWIAPWPGYLSGWQPCEWLPDGKIRCAGSIQEGNFALRVDLTTLNASFEGTALSPYSLVYATEKGVEEKKFSGQTVGFSLILAPDGEEYKYILADPLQADSMFTRLFFLEGHGLKCFQKFDDVRPFSGGRVITWKVDYDCRQENKVFFADSSSGSSPTSP